MLQTCTCAACGHLTEFFLLLFSLASIVSLAFLLKGEFDDATTMDRVFLMVTYILTLVFAVIVLVKVFNRWRDASSELTLVANERRLPLPAQPEPVAVENSNGNEHAASDAVEVSITGVGTSTSVEVGTSASASTPVRRGATHSQRQRGSNRSEDQPLSTSMAVAVIANMY